MNAKTIEAGLRSGRLVVQREDGRINGGLVAVLCRCDCGKTTRVSYYRVRTGKVLSCGCYARESSSLRNRTHGMRNSREYKSWDSMRARCLNAEHKDFARYGGRGIKVCSRWLDSFENFFADMGPKPTPRHSLDRYPDNDGDYEPGNCRWATSKQQARNRRSNRPLTIAGETKLLCEWGKDTRLACSPSAFEKRIHAGWEPIKAFNTPNR